MDSIGEFHEAVLNNDEASATKMLAAGVDIDAGDDDGFTALHWAAQEGIETMVRFLLDRGANPNVLDKEGISPLYVAISKKHPDMANLLIERKADVFMAPSDGFTLLHAAASVGDCGTARNLIMLGCNVNSQDESGSGRTPIHWAVQEGYLDMVMLLIEAGADPNITEEHGFTPLCAAAGEGHVRVAKFLLTHGAIIENPRASQSPLHLATAHRRIQIVRLLVENGANVNFTSEKEKLPALYYAVRYGVTDIVRYLIQKGARTDFRIHGRSTLIKLARKLKYDDIVDLLSEKP